MQPGVEAPVPPECVPRARTQGPRIYEALNFFQKDVFAPAPYWMAMPEMTILTASKTSPPPSQHVSIAIVHVDGNHYIKVV
ncbi:hypothetical protein OSB04_030693 [Centaurea solstitialis]|uniref:Uncharacterized protein n=1 Tax=Centaurea solstitialis TaxID=347529 RepID=A0AA38S852_9ASTR|nr:hypothetical protein OSB04_030693 [Centaurea solstitialis]